jgi:Mg2+ and Co2+ transporter CorA
MRANINLNIHIDQVKNLSRNLLTNEGQRLVELVTGFNESIVEPHKKEDFDEVLENINELREHLADIDMMLAQAGNILSGYHNRDQEEEIDVGKMKSSVEQRLQQAEKFNSFLEKISDQVIEETTQDGEE